MKTQQHITQPLELRPMNRLSQNIDDHVLSAAVFKFCLLHPDSIRQPEVTDIDMA